MFDPRKIIETLNRHGVEYVIIGGFAATLYGCPEQTFDLDILSDVLGVGTYEQAKTHAQTVSVGELRMAILDLPTLIATKEAAADPNPRKRSGLDYLKALQQRNQK